MRFAIEELKIALCSIVKKLRFYPVEETPVRNKPIQSVISVNSKLFLQEELQFEEGLLTVVQPIHAIVGVEVRS
jgi:hypothetical protein